MDTPQKNGRALNFQTNLEITFNDNTTEKFMDIHPDIQLEILDGMLTFESTSGTSIWYIPASNIKHFKTVCEKV